MRHLILILSFVFLVRIASADTEALTALPGDSTVQAKVSAVDENVPVPVPEPSARAVQRHQSGIAFWLIREAWGMVLPVFLLFTGFSARLRDRAQRIGRRWYWIICVYFVMLMLINYGLNWPLRYYLGFVRPHAYGLSHQTFVKWFADSGKALGVTLVVGCLVLWIPYLLLKKSPRRWWLYAWLAMLPVFFFGALVEPLVVAPLFNKFGPVKDQALEAKIIALAEKAGIHGGRVFEVNKSVDTKTSNAYVSGFLGTKRIVLWDTIIAQLNERELLFVLGHEMGHYALGHVVKGILCSWMLTLVALYGIHLTGGALIRRHAGRFGFTSLADIASLPLMILLVSIFSLMLTPIGFAYSRHMEHEADRFGLEITHFNHSAATGFVKMDEVNLAYPRPGLLYTIWLGTHPSSGDRIDFFNEYKPWEKGEPQKYGRYFGQKK